MKLEFRNYLIKGMIEKCGFLPAHDQENIRLIHESRSLLVKSSHNYFALVEIVDGDALSAKQIETELKNNEKYLTELQLGGEKYFYKVFVFSERPQSDIRHSIAKAHYDDMRERKHLKCIILDLSSSKVDTCFDVKWDDKKLIKLLQDSLVPSNQVDISEAEIISLADSKEKEYQLEVSGEKPILTYTLIAINIIVYAVFYLYSIKSGKNYSELIYTYGAKVNSKIMEGEFFRFLTPVFLHANLTHLLINCYSLYAVGTSVEVMFGKRKFLVVYFTAGILGNIASFAFTPSWGIGASGAIFGLLGALLFFGVMRPTLFKMLFGYNILITIVINLTYGFSVSGIDNYAHIGGLIGGFLATGIAANREEIKWYLNRMLYIGLAIFIFAAGTIYGFNSAQNKYIYKVNQLSSYVDSKEWDKVLNTARDVLTLKQGDDNTRISVLTMLIEAQVNKENYNAAIDSAYTIKSIDSGRGSYLLGILYYDMKQFDLSKQNLILAKKAGIKNEIIDKLLSTMK